MRLYVCFFTKLEPLSQHADQMIKVDFTVVPMAVRQNNYQRHDIQLIVGLIFGSASEICAKSVNNR